MIKEEIWGIAVDRARAFFREHADIREENPNLFHFHTCRIALTELKPKGMGVWAAKRTRVQMDGDDRDVEEIYHRFFIRFLTTGG